MEFQKIQNADINEYYYYMKHPSGLSIYVYPKKDYASTYAIFGTDFGSINNSFKLKNSEKITKVPNGVAHFLEHKLFENENINALESYSKTGASANAYTSFEKTAYLFSCTENFYESLDILLDFVQNPYFTEESIKKEQGIIAQEIKMYEDSPSWRVLINLLKALYYNHPVKINIAGSVESIAEITPKILYTCYNTFYNLNNMALCVAGNVDADEFFSKIEPKIKRSTNEIPEFESCFPNEPIAVVKRKTEQKLDVMMPMFNLGFKESANKLRLTDEEVVYIGLVLCAISSRSSRLYEILLSEELINTSSFGCEHFEGPWFSSIIFSGESKRPEKVAQIIYSEIENIKKNGLNENSFNNAKKAMYAEIISSFNKVSKVANKLLHSAFTNHEIFNKINLIKNAEFGKSNELLQKILNNDLSALSIIYPND